MHQSLVKTVPILILTIIVCFSLFSNTPVNQLTSEQLEDSLDCGLTDDFINFLNQRGIFMLTIKVMEILISIELISSVDHMVVKRVLLINLLNYLLFSCMATVM